MKIFGLSLFVTYDTIICLEFWIKNLILISSFKLRPKIFTLFCIIFTGLYLLFCPFFCIFEIFINFVLFSVATFTFLRFYELADFISSTNGPQSFSDHHDIWEIQINSLCARITPTVLDVSK